MSRRVIGKLGHASWQRPWLTLFLVAIVTGFAVHSAVRNLRIEMDVATMLPQNSQVWSATKQARESFGGFDFLMVALEVSPKAPADVRANPRAFLETVLPQIQDELDDQRFFRRQLAHPPSLVRDPARADAERVALFSAEDFRAIEEVFLLPNLRRRLSTIVGAPPAPTDDLFGLDAILSRKDASAYGPLRNEPGRPWEISEDGRMGLLLLWPVEQSTNLIKARELREYCEAVRKGLFQRNPIWRTAVQIQFRGAHIDNAEGASDIRRDIFTTAILSLLAVLVLFLVAFRQPQALIFVAVPLLVGLSWTLGLVSLFIPRLTQVTITFAAILIGLGVDFSIHLYNRFLEELRLGAEPEAALESSIRNTTPSLVAGAITTMIGFIGLALTNFVGFRELGVFGAVGIVTSLLAVMIVFPPLMAVCSFATSPQRGPGATMGLRKITFMVQSYPRLTVCAGMCIATFLGLFATKVTFNPSLSGFQTPTPEEARFEERLEERFALPSDQVAVIVSDPTLEGVLRQNDALAESLESASRGKSAPYPGLWWDSLRTHLPSAATQLGNAERFLRLPWSGVIELIRAEQAAGKLPAPDYFNATLARLRAVRDQVTEWSAARQAPLVFEVSPAGSRLHSYAWLYLYRENEGEPFMAITRVYPARAQWPEGVPMPFVERITKDIAAVAPKAPPPTVLGNAILGAEIEGVILRDLTTVGLIVMIAVIGYLMFHFRSVGKATLAMIPVLFGLLCMLGIMQAIGMQLNYLNVISLPLIIGIGVDSGIHLISRIYEGEGYNLRPAIEKTGRGIVISSLTTVLGFGALSVASFSGIREIGLLCIIGLLATLFAALLILPATIRLLDRNYTYAGGPGDDIG